MHSIKIIGYAILASCVYGIIHDQITARICLEYFTLFHPKLVNSTNSTVVAFAWGIAATWWVGAILGVFMAISARMGKLPKLTWKSVIKPSGILFAIMGLSAFLFGLFGLYQGKSASFFYAFYPKALSPEKYSAFAACLCAHNASYTVGFIGGFVIVIWLIIKRVQLNINQLKPKNPLNDVR